MDTDRATGRRKLLEGEKEIRERRREDPPRKKILEVRMKSELRNVTDENFWRGEGEKKK